MVPSHDRRLLDVDDDDAGDSVCRAAADRQTNYRNSLQNYENIYIYTYGYDFL